MKKGLVIGAVLVACAFAFTGAALAAEISTSGTIEFTLSGTSEEGEPSGLFGAGDVLVDYSVTLTSDSWEANLTPEFDLASEALTFDDAYIKYSLETLAFTMKPLGIDKELFDVEGKDGEPDIPSKPGIGVNMVVAPLTLDLAVNNQAVGDEAKFNFAFGAKYGIDSVTLEAVYGLSDVETADWYGSYYGVLVLAELDSLTLEGQYGTFSPEAAGLEDGSGYYAKVAYGLSEGLGTVAVEYWGADKELNGKGTPTAEDYSRIKGKYEHPLTDAVSLTLSIDNITPGTEVEGVEVESYTKYKAVIGVSL